MKCKPQTQIERARDAAQAKRKRKLPDIEALVCCDILHRQDKKGIPKYGMTVAENPLSQREWLIHLYHELLDAAIYAKRQLVEPKTKEQNEKQDKGKNLLRRRNDSNGAGNMDAG